MLIQMDSLTRIAEEITPYLQHWDIEAVAVTIVSHSENIVYKATTAQGKHYALRVHRPGYHTRAELASEQIWTDALLQAGLRVPEAYPTLAGDYYVAAKCGGLNRQLGVVGWLEGEPLANHIDSDDGVGDFPLQQMTEAGAICAQFHNQASNWIPPKGFTRPHLNVEGLLGEQPFWGRFWDVATLTTSERKVINAHRQSIVDILLEYGQPPHAYSMIHADLHEGNLFLGPDGMTVIDFDDSGFGWHQYDLAVALVAQSDRRDFDAIKTALFDGYQLHRPLSEQDLYLVDVFLLMRTLALIGWSAARPELDQDDYLPSLVDKACRMVL
jgi:Ser/Thr protein kinase RdoA (MazF antagonist)